jgi:hypothetical protein
MTSKDDDLVEKMARAMRQYQMDAVCGEGVFDEDYPLLQSELEEAASGLAIARPVIEREALMKAMDTAAAAELPEGTECCDDWRTGHWHGRRDAALAIRALIPRDEEENQ